MPLSVNHPYALQLGARAQEPRVPGPMLLVLLTLALAGCDRSQPVAGDKPDTARQQLQQIGTAYNQARLTLNHPPQSLDELRPFLQDPQRSGKTAEVLRSPNDGEDYVIVWSVDFNDLAKKIPNPYVVFAYEKHGKRGKRHVMQLPNFVSIMTDAEFQKAPFPPGHQPQP